ncbi:MAG: FAD-binding oxidoreductase, partial [Rhodospirillales bacterium]|nr:FAD-binding oxidoreductase [Rhodospirillales bacterium]
MPDTTIIPTIPTAPVTPAILESLRAIVGDKGLISDDQGKQPFVTDWRGSIVGNAAVVVRPATVEEVSKVVKLCHDNGIAIVPQAGNTSLMGGATPWPSHTGIVLSVGRMNKVLNVDPVGYSMTVEAGCVLQTLQETAASHDRFFPLFLGAQGSCMIGGNLSTNAGGVQVLRYGNARNLVMGLEVVLPNGDIWNGLRALKKDNTGYDLKHLFMGAEGTLGIITKAVLKLWPASKDVATAWLAIRDPQAAIEILSEAHGASEDNVGSCELMSRTCTDMVLRNIPGTQDPLKADTQWFLLLEWTSARPKAEGAEGMSDKMEQFLADQMEAGRVLDAVIAQSEAQARNMWIIRESVAPASRAEGPGLSYDISVSISKVPEFIERGLQAALDILPSIRPYPLGHIGDGNIHFSFMGPKGMDRPTLSQYSPAITRAVNDLVTSLDGSISAEHG